MILLSIEFLNVGFSQVQFAPTPAIRNIRFLKPEIKASLTSIASANVLSAEDIINAQKNLRHRLFEQRKSKWLYYASRVKGNAIENTIVSNYLRLEKLYGYSNYSSYLKYRGNNGIDGFFVRKNQFGNYEVKILEVKSGRANLKESSGMIEMSQEWILDRIERSIANLDVMKESSTIIELKNIKQAIEKGTANIERTLIRGNIQSGNFVISNRTIPVELKQSSQLAEKTDVDFTLKSEHEISLAKKSTLTHGKQKVQKDLYQNLYKELTEGPQKVSKKQARKLIKQIEHNKNIASNIALAERNSFERMAEKSTRSIRTRLELGVMKIPTRTIRVFYGIMRTLPFVMIGVEVLVDIKDIYDVASTYYNGSINTQALLIRTAGVLGGIAGSLAGGWAGAKLGALTGAAIGTAICPGVGSGVGATIGTVIGSLIGAFSGYNLGRYLSMHATAIMTLKYFPSMKSDTYFGLLCRNTDEYCRLHL